MEIHGNVWKCPSMHQAWQKEYRHSLVPKTAPLSENSVDVGDRRFNPGMRDVLVQLWTHTTYSIWSVIIQLRGCPFFFHTAAQLHLASYCWPDRKTCWSSVKPCFRHEVNLKDEYQQVQGQQEITTLMLGAQKEAQSKRVVYVCASLISLQTRIFPHWILQWLRIRNIPNRYSQRDLIAELEDLGFGGELGDCGW